jgi:hypothetical protein
MIWKFVFNDWFWDDISQNEFYMKWILSLGEFYYNYNFGYTEFYSGIGYGELFYIFINIGYCYCIQFYICLCIFNFQMFLIIGSIYTLNKVSKQLFLNLLNHYNYINKSLFII